MTRLQLIQKLRQETGIPEYAAKSAVRLIFDTMSETLAAGGRVEIRGLCSFYVKEYKSYTGRNPKTQKKVKVKPKKMPYFKCGRELKQRVNEG